MAETSPKRLENNEEKGEIARFEQIFLFQQCFQNTCTAETVNLSFSRTSFVFSA